MLKKIVIKTALTINFIVLFLFQMVIANLRVARDVITPGTNAKPGVIAIPLDCRRDLEITLLAIVISLTPGTLALDISDDKQTMYIHDMFMADKEKIIKHIKTMFEIKLIRILC